MNSGFGHGKIILLGEHAVVHGEPALAAGLAAGVTAHASPGGGRLRVAPWGLDATAGDGTQAGDALARLLDHMGTRALDFEATAAIPSRAGLGSSAALAVALARAAAARLAAAETRALRAADEAERVFHLDPSGVDVAAASSGRVGVFRRAEGWRPIAAPRLRVCIGLTGRPRDTAALVAQVARHLEARPAERARLARLGDLARDGATALARGDAAALGPLLAAAQTELAALGVSSAEIDALIELAAKAGAAGAKLTGAGGGGAVIALAPGREDAVLAAWRAAGFQALDTEIGGE